MKKLFTLLAAALLTVGSTWADTVELIPSQIKAAATGSTTFKNGYEITNASSKNIGSGNDDYAKKTKYIKYSSGVVYTIVIPEGRQVTGMTITGGTRKAGTTTYLAELNYVTYGSSDYVFVDGLDKQTVEPTTHSFTFETPAKGSISFKHQGTESIFNLVLTDEEEQTVGASGLAWSEDAISYKIRDNVPEAPTFLNPNNLPVTFTTTDAEIAAVDESGVVTLFNNKVGMAKVRATFAGNDDFEKEILELNVDVKTNEVFVRNQYPDVEPSYFILDKMLPASKDSYEAGEIFVDENLQIIAHSATISTKKYSGNFGGYTFTRGIQVRVANDPNEDHPYGLEYGDDIADETTSLVVKPKVDMTLYVYGRRQVEEDPSLRQIEDDEANNVVTVNQYYMFYANDGKSLKFNEVDNPTEVLEKNSYLGKWDGIDYIYGISEIELEAGKEYNMYAVGTTYIVNGVGYIVANKESNVINTTSHVVGYIKDATSATDDFGFTLARTGASNVLKGNSSANTITVNGADYQAFRMKGLITANLDQVTYSVTAPANMTIKKATIYAFANSGADTEETYFTQVGNHTFAKGDLEPITSTSNTAPVVFTVDHIMLNKMDMNLHTDQDKDISVVVDVEYIYTEHSPAAPVLTVDGEEATADEYEFESETAVVINPSAAHHNIYFHFAAEEAQPAPAKVMLYAENADSEAPAATMVHEGKTFTLMPADGVTIDKAGTLSFFAHDPLNDLTSEVKTLKVKGNGVVTGIENVAVDAAAAQVEYFNLQGIRVANPENGVFIRRQGNDVKKVVL